MKILKDLDPQNEKQMIDKKLMRIVAEAKRIRVHFKHFIEYGLAKLLPEKWQLGFGERQSYQELCIKAVNNEL